MERKDRKRKALDPLFVSERITELTLELKQNDAVLREEIEELRDEISRLKKHLESKSEESARFQAEAEFLHPDAVVDRVRTKFWHHGDLSLLRRAIDPRMRVLRNTENRSDRALYICDTAPKKAGSKTQFADSRPYDLSPKQECEEASTSTNATMDPVEPPSHDVDKKEPDETDCVSDPAMPVPEDTTQTETWLQQEAKPVPPQDITNDVLVCCPK